MRVFLDTEPLLHWPSGISVYVRGLLSGFRQMAEAGPEVVTGYATARGPLRRQLRDRLQEFGARAEWHEWPLPGRLAGRLGPLRRFACVPSLSPVDIVHGTSFLTPKYVPGSLRVVTIHDLGFVRHPDRRFGGDVGDRMIQDTLAEIEHADHIIADSEFTKSETCDICGVPADRVSVVGLGTQWSAEDLPTPRRVAEVLARHGLEEGKYFLTVGLISPRKNFSGLLDAFEIFRRESPDAQLALVGGIGWDAEPVLDRLTRLAPSARRLEVGDAVDLAALYVGARAFLLFSWYEGFGIPVLEAMQCGCPVCASSPGALAELVGDAGMTVPADDQAAAVDAMRRLWNDAEWRAELRGKGLARAAQYGWLATARGTLGVYRSVLDGKRNSHGANPGERDG